MDANNGLGRVISKEKYVLHDTIGYSISACRHSNGRDWWIIMQEQNSNCFYKILVDPSGEFKISKDCEGAKSKAFIHQSPASCFSPKGDQFAYVTRSDGLYLFDFDRCTGTLSHRTNIKIKEIQDSMHYVFSVAYSETGRFIYISTGGRVLQFDMWSSNIENTRFNLGEFDYYIDTIATFSPYAILSTMQLAPNKKIYIASGNATLYFHEISYPDLPKDSCQFKQRGLRLPTFNGSIPNFPYFRLWKAEEECITLEVNHKSFENVEIQVFPNPANDYFVLNSNALFSNIEILDKTGRKVQVFGQLDDFKIDISRLDEGTYIVYVRDQNGKMSYLKLVKQ